MDGREFLHGVSVIIDDFHLVGVELSPSEARTPLVVDSNTVLSGSFSFENFQLIAGWREQILQCISFVQVYEFAPRGPLYFRRQLSRHLSAMDFLGFLICETFNHRSYYHFAILLSSDNICAQRKGTRMQGRMTCLRHRTPERIGTSPDLNALRDLLMTFQSPMPPHAQPRKAKKARTPKHPRLFHDLHVISDGTRYSVTGVSTMICTMRQ